MARLSIKTINLSGIHRKINYKDLLKGVPRRDLEEQYFKETGTILTEAQVRELEHIILCADFYNKIKLKTAVALTNDEKTIEVVFSTIEGALDNFAFILTYTDVLSSILKWPTEISFEAENNINNEVITNVVLFISTAQKEAGEENKLSRLELKNVQPQFVLLEKIFAAPRNSNSAIIITQMPTNFYNIEISASASAKKDSFVVDFCRPFIGDLSLLSMMKLEPRNSQRRVTINDTFVTLEQLRQLTPLVAANSSTSVRNLESGQLCFSSRPVESRNARHTVHIVGQKADVSTLAVECLTSFVGDSPKSLVLEGTAFNRSISIGNLNITEITFKGTEFDAELFDHLFITLASLPQLCALHFNRVTFKDKEQRTILIKDILPSLKLLSSLTFENCEFDEDDSKNIAMFLLNNPLLRKLAVAKPKGTFNIKYLVDVVSAKNTVLTELIDDTNVAAKDAKLKNTLDENNKLKKFNDCKVTFNGATEAFHETVKNPDILPPLGLFIESLTELYPLFESLLLNHKELLKCSRFVASDAMEYFPRPEHMVNVINSLCESLVIYFSRFLQANKESLHVLELFRAIDKFFVTANATDFSQTLIRAYFNVVKVNGDNREFSYSLIEKTRVYKQNDGALIAKKFFGDCLETFSHQKIYTPPNAWWTIFERLCTTELGDLAKNDKIELLNKFILPTFKHYLMPLLKVEFGKPHYLGNPSIDPAIVERVINKPGVPLQELYEILLDIWNCNVQIPVMLIRDLSPCDLIVAKLLHHLGPIMPSLLNVQAAQLARMPSSLTTLTLFFSAVTTTTPVATRAAPSVAPSVPPAALGVPKSPSP